jgi:hypothetical protein
VSALTVSPAEVVVARTLAAWLEWIQTTDAWPRSAGQSVFLSHLEGLLFEAKALASNREPTDAGRDLLDRARKAGVLPGVEAAEPLTEGECDAAIAAVRLQPPFDGDGDILRRLRAMRSGAREHQAGVLPREPLTEDEARAWVAQEEGVSAYEERAGYLVIEDVIRLLLAADRGDIPPEVRKP